MAIFRPAVCWNDLDLTYSGLECPVIANSSEHCVWRRLICKDITLHRM